MEELFRALHAQVKERLASPLIGAFAISWFFWNYKFVVILLSKESVLKSFEMINDLIYPDGWAIFWRGVFAPLVTSIAYIFIYPYPAKFVYEFNRKRQKELLEIKRKIEEETPLTLEESRRIRRETDRRISEINQVIDGKDREIDRLKEELVELKGSDENKGTGAGIVDMEDVVEESDDLDRLQFELLEKIGISVSGLSKRDVIGGHPEDKIASEFALDELVNKGFVEKFSARVNGQPIGGYRLTQDGRGAVLRHRKKMS